MAANQDTVTPSGGSAVLKEFQLSTDIQSKLSPEYGKEIARYVASTFGGTSSYYFARNARFRANRDIANGRINMSKYVDRLEFNGVQNYANLNWSAIKLVNTAIAQMVAKWMGRNEKIRVTAVDLTSQKEKQDQADQAEFVFDNKEMLAQIQQESGVPMVPQDQFIAEDKDELDTWKMQFNKLPEEISYQLGVNDILAANGFFGVNKEKQLHDSAEVGLVGTYTEMNEDGEITVEWIKPENMLYSYSEYPDFRDTTWRGRIKSMKISYLRSKYGAQFGGKLTEEQLWEIAQTAKDYQLYDKMTQWNQNWNYAIVRPYDEWNITVVDFELKSLDRIPYTVTKTKTNGSTIVNKGVPKKVKENQKVKEDKQWNIYRGVYAVDSQVMLEWGLKKNMVIPQDPKEIGNVEFSYEFFMPNNYDMRNVAIPERCDEPLDQLIITRLKIQQLIAKMKPAGASINTDALQELDLGLAKATTPIEAERIWNQTGNFYYRGRDAEGNPIPLPIQELPNNGFAPQMDSLIKLYQFNLQVLRDELGFDTSLSAQATKPRVTEGNINTAVQLGDNATETFYDAWLYCMEGTARKIACLLNKSVSYGAKKYAQIMKQEDVKGRVFNTKFEMLPDEVELQKLEAMMNNAIISNPQMCLYLDVFHIMRVAKEDIDLAELLFKQSQKRYLKTEAAIAQKNSENNAAIQEKSMIAKAEGDSKLEDKKNLAKEKQILLQGSFDLLKGGVDIPEDLKNIMTAVIQNISLPMVIENQQIKAEIQQMQLQQQQEQMQEQQMQQQPQEQAA